MISTTFPLARDDISLLCRGWASVFIVSPPGIHISVGISVWGYTYHGDTHITVTPVSDTSPKWIDREGLGKGKREMDGRIWQDNSAGRHTRKFIYLSKYGTEKWHKEGQNNSFQRKVQLPIFKGRWNISMVSIRRHNTSWKHSLLFDDRAQPSAMCRCSSELNTTGECDKMKDLRRIVMIDLYHFEL